MRKKSILAASALAVVTLLLPACETASSSSTASSSAAAVRAWVASGGKAKLSLVNADMNAIGHDATRQLAADLIADGAQLAKDATAAEASPLPGAVADYVTAMRTLASAGADLALGNVAQATAEIKAADAPLMRAVGAYNQALGLGTQ